MDDFDDVWQGLEDQANKLRKLAEQLLKDVQDAKLKMAKRESQTTPTEAKKFQAYLASLINKHPLTNYPASASTEPPSPILAISALEDEPKLLLAKGSSSAKRKAVKALEVDHSRKEKAKLIRWEKPEEKTVPKEFLIGTSETFKTLVFQVRLYSLVRKTNVEYFLSPQSYSQVPKINRPR